MSAPVSSPADAVLVVYPFCLDHVGHGNIQRILAMARYFASHGTAVDLVYQGSSRVPAVQGQYDAFRRVFAVDGAASSSDAEAWARRLAAFYSGHELPRPHMRPSAPLTALTRSLVEAEPYKAVVATYAFTAPIFSGLHRRVVRVCDVQDVMHEHAAACEDATGQSSSFDMPAATEAFLWRQWDVLVAITPQDCARIRRDTLPRQHVVSARHAVAALAPAASPGMDDVALYAGSDNQSNVQSVTWLLERVWPMVRRMRPAARLRIAGLICSALPDALRNAEGVEILGFQPDVSPHLASCGVLVAPYLYGSGLKIKVVEAACAGKAIVTTTAGVAGAGLEPGRCLAVHDDPEAFASAVAGLLGDRAQRTAMANAARTDAAALFSPEACYGPVRLAMSLLATAPAPGEAHATAVEVPGRVKTVVEHVRPARLILWGNGSHTRALIGALRSAAITVHLIVDGRASGSSTSPEGVPVIDAPHFQCLAGDLIVLSSETFESQMWVDLTGLRDAGARVLGLSNHSYISRALLGSLSSGVLTQMGAPLDLSRPTAACVLWDSGAVPERWWRLCLLRDLADGVHRVGAVPIVVTPASLAANATVIGDMPASARVLPLLELSGWDVEAQNVDGGASGLTRATDLLTTSARQALALLDLRADDLLVVREPSLSECAGLARALESIAPARRPRIVLWSSGPGHDTLQLRADDRRAYWRLAISALAHACDERLTIVTHDASSRAQVADVLQRPVHAIGCPTAAAARAASPHIVCLGHVAVPGVRSVLEALSRAFVEGTHTSGRATISWRSNQHDGRPGARQQWATDLAATLGITLLDDAVPSRVRNAIAGADAVVILDGATREWLTAAHVHAAAGLTPVIEPSGPGDAVERVGTLLDGTRAQSGRSVLSLVRETPAMNAEEVAARMLDAVNGCLLLVPSIAPAPPWARPAPVERNAVAMEALS